MVERAVFLDTNVFMYAAGASHPCKEPCIRVLVDVEKGNLTAVTNTEVLQEILYRYRHLRIPDKGVELCRLVLDYPLAIFPVTEEDIRAALDLYNLLGSRGLQPRDAIHAATMKNHGLSHIISADRALGHVETLIRIDPLRYLSWKAET